MDDEIEERGEEPLLADERASASPQPSTTVGTPGQRFLRRVLSDRGAWGDDDELDLDAVLADDYGSTDIIATDAAAAAAAGSPSATQSSPTPLQMSPGTLTGTAAALIPMPIAEQGDEVEDDELMDVDGSCYGEH